MKIENVKVNTVDSDKLIEFLAIELKENQKLNIENFCVFDKYFAIDPDCCFNEISHAHLDGIIQPIIEIECRIKTYSENGSYKMRMDKPDFVKVISLSQYLKLSNEKKLTDFIRFNYNPRIQGNQNLLMKYIRQVLSVPTA